MKPNRTREEILLLSKLQQGVKRLLTPCSENTIQRYVHTPTGLWI